MNQARDPKHSMTEQAMRMEEQRLKANRIGWPAAFMVFSLCIGAALITWAMNPC